MASNKNRKTKYTTLNITEEADAAFRDCVQGKTLSQTMLEIVRVYNKSKCLNHHRGDSGVITAD